jgi:general secretion pathway protein E
VAPLTGDSITNFALHMMNERQRQEFESQLDIDLAYSTPDGVRYRVNLFQQRGEVGMVLRLIPPEVPSFESLHLPDTVLRLADNPRGLVLVTGITGSGKSTTLAAMIDYINRRRANHVVTVEDPVEYTLDGINQVQMQPNIGLTFATALRSFLRQDPDIMMVGEIRDLETAQIAVQAALTGHLVLSTLHTNTAPGSVTRLLDMGIEDYLLAPTLSVLAAQRLVRRLCPVCSEADEMSPHYRALFEEAGVEPDEQVNLRRPVGCTDCHHTGFRGRLAILEVLDVGADIRSMILEKADTAGIEQCAVRGGMRPMYQDGLDKVLAGQTTLDEVLRVTRDVEAA